MLVYDFADRKDKTLYEFLYNSLKRDILNGRLAQGSKLPSKRALAKDNQISVRTVMNAYEQLLAEGFIVSEEKRGYFVAKVYEDDIRSIKRMKKAKEEKQKDYVVDFTAHKLVCDKFPVSMWKKIMREVLTDYDTELIEKADYRGIRKLRRAIADYLYRSRGMNVDEECVVIGAGIEYLFGRLYKIFPKDSIYAMENPGYQRIRHIYEDYSLKWKCIAMDEEGIKIRDLEESNAKIIHTSPEHHFPLGITMSKKRREELLKWSNEEPDRYIIEDDYDCEYRYDARLAPAIQCGDETGRVIYINSFSKSLAPSIRISYMVLPKELMEKYKKIASVYSNSVCSCEQYALAKFLDAGYFERHMRRMKKYCQEQGNRLLKALKQSEIVSKAEIYGGKSGTHFLVKVDTRISDEELVEKAKKQKVKIRCLSKYCREDKESYRHTLVFRYTDASDEEIKEAIHRLEKILKKNSSDTQI